MTGSSTTAMRSSFTTCAKSSLGVDEGHNDAQQHGCRPHLALSPCARKIHEHVYCTKNRHIHLSGVSLVNLSGTNLKHKWDRSLVARLAL